jgi:hypothetical protein
VQEAAWLEGCGASAVKAHPAFLLPSWMGGCQKSAGGAGGSRDSMYVHALLSKVAIFCFEQVAIAMCRMEKTSPPLISDIY